MPIPYMLVALVFMSVALLAYALFDLAFSDDRRVSRRLKDLTEYERAQAREAEPLLMPFRTRVLAPLGASLASSARSLWPADYKDRVSARLQRAGSPRGIDVGRFLVSKIAASLGTFGLLCVVGLFAGWSLGSTAFLSVALGVLGFFAPDLWLDGVLRRRQHQIVKDLPDMLDMLTISVEAGLGFDAALSKLVRGSKGPLAEEFGRVLQETQAGSSRKEALRHMAERVDVPALSAFTAAIIQADIFGISISQVLRTQAAEMRLRRRQRAEEEAQKAPVKMVIPLVLCILPATIIVVAGPAVLRILSLFAR